MVLQNLIAGGGQRQTINLARGLVARGWKVSILVLEENGEMEKEVPPEVKLIFSEPHTVSPIKFLIKTFSILKVIKKTKPQLIYARLDHAPAAVAGKIAGIPTVITLVDNPEDKTVERGFFGSIISVQKRKLGVKTASCIVANSHGLAQECEQFFRLKSKPAVIHNGLDFNLIKEKSLENMSHKWIDESCVSLCVSVGRLEKQKGFENLIDAFSILNKRMKARLLIVGDGKLRISLAERIKRLGLEDTVSLVGQTINPYPFFAAADLYVQSSVHEGFSNTLVEAGYLGKPIVSTDHPFGANEIVDHGENGLLTPVNNPQAMTDAIEKVLQNPELLKRMGGNSAKKARDFTIEKMSSEYEKLFRNLVV